MKQLRKIIAMKKSYLPFLAPTLLWHPENSYKSSLSPLLCLLSPGKYKCFILLSDKLLHMELFKPSDTPRGSILDVSAIMGVKQMNEEHKAENTIYKF